MPRGSRAFRAWAVAAFAAFTIEAGAAADADPMAGLWKAQRFYGPAMRGPLRIERTGAGFVAEMAGRVLPVEATGAALAFTMPDGQGSFRGRLEEGGAAITGHWYPPKTRVTGGLFWFASPVRLERAARGRWSGVVEPPDDTFTLYLKVEPRAAGVQRAFLRNPERNIGVFVGVERLERAGERVELWGRLRGEKKESRLLAGTYDARNDLLTVFFPERGGSYDFRREGDDSNFYPRGRNPGPYTYRPPPALDDGWPVGTLDQAGIDRAAIERFIQALLDTPIDSVNAREVHAILIARHGRLVLEEYFHGEHRFKLHDTRSAAKSLTATLIGAAMHAGVPLRLASPVYAVMHDGALPAGLDPLKRAMTLEHLLTMSSGFFCDDGNPDAPGNEDAMLEQRREPDFYRYTLEVPMATPPGERAVYCSVNPNLALGMLGRAAGESPMALFDRLLGGPMQIPHYGWFLDPAGQPYGGGSVEFRPRDFMKLGQLMLDGGTWKGRRILSRDFVAQASARRYHLNNVYYGYTWWNTDLPYRDRTVRVFWAGGNGGQGVMVVPELELVVATHGGSYATRVGLHIQQELAARYIIPAVRERGDDASLATAPEEWTTPYGRSERRGPVPEAER